jgi:DNA polymerase-4
MRGTATILHADLDAFYASVEVRDDPSLAGKPVAVGGGVVLAATYEARRYGVRSAMTGGQARARCPGLIVVPARFTAYVEASRQIMEILERFTPRIEPISIDEAFLDVAGARALFGSPVEIAGTIRAEVRREAQLPISIGIASTKHLAKIASRLAKPDGLVAVEPGTEEEFLAPLPVGLLWGVGPVGEEHLARYGIATIGDLAALPPKTLAGWLGPHWGEHLWHLAHNQDHRSVERGHGAGSVGAQSAGDATDVDRRHRTLLSLADRIGTRLRRKGIAGRRITVRVRFREMRSVTRARMLPGPISETTSIYRVAAELADGAVAESADETVTLVGISVSALTRRPHLQLELALGGLDGDPATRPGSPTSSRLRDLDAAVDAARERYGRDAVRRAAVAGHEPEQRSPTDELEAPERRPAHGS